jgi:hypothetical protein
MGAVATWRAGAASGVGANTGDGTMSDAGGFGEGETAAGESTGELRFTEPRYSTPKTSTRLQRTILGHNPSPGVVDPLSVVDMELLLNLGFGQT